MGTLSFFPLHSACSRGICFPSSRFLSCIDTGSPPICSHGPDFLLKTPIVPRGSAFLLEMHVPSGSYFSPPMCLISKSPLSQRYLLPSSWGALSLEVLFLSSRCVLRFCFPPQDTLCHRGPDDSNFSFYMFIYYWCWSSLLCIYSHFCYNYFCVIVTITLYLLLYIFVRLLYLFSWYCNWLYVSCEDYYIIVHHCYIQVVQKILFSLIHNTKNLLQRYCQTSWSWSFIKAITNSIQHFNDFLLTFNNLNERRPTS